MLVQNNFVLKKGLHKDSSIRSVRALKIKEKKKTVSKKKSQTQGIGIEAKEEMPS